MGFQPGHVANPKGRPKGSKNLTSAKVKKFLDQVVYGDMDLLKTDWRKLTSVQRVTLAEKFSKYVIPALGQSSIDVTKIDPAKFSDEQMSLVLDNINMKVV